MGYVNSNIELEKLVTLYVTMSFRKKSKARTFHFKTNFQNFRMK